MISKENHSVPVRPEPSSRPLFQHANALLGSQPSRNWASSSGSKPKKSVFSRGCPALSRSCTMVAVTVEGTLPRK